MKAVKVIKFMTEEKAEEIREWLGNTKDRHWEPTTVAIFSEEDHHQLRHGVRKGERLIANVIPRALADYLNSTLWEGIAQYKEEMEESYPIFKDAGGFPGTKADEHLEPVQILRYYPGDFYSWHTDHFSTGGIRQEHTIDPIERKLSIVLYLSNDFEGGQTEFVNGRIIKPKPGEGIVFPSNQFYPHRAKPVISGVKYALVTWTNGMGSPIPYSFIR